MFNLNPEYRRLHKRLDLLAGSGHYEIQDLQAIRSKVLATQSRELAYYLASLFLHSGDTVAAHQLLSKDKRASRSMKKFCRVLLYCLDNGLHVPTLSTREKDCLNYLDRIVNPQENPVEQLIASFDGVIICGNAPMNAVVSCPENWCRIFFNDYKKNPEITDDATIHVVTPSWNGKPDSSSYRCITGNDIFYRRSQVWKRFIDDKSYQAIFTVPREIWAELYAKTGTSPSAGLLILSYIAHLFIQNKLPDGFSVSVTGFSMDQSGVNHTYDSVVASTRHNWLVEKEEINRLKDVLKIRGCLLSLQT